MAIEERLLVEQCKNGNLEVFGDLYDVYVRKIYEFIYFKTHHKQIAEDLTSQVFLKAIENFKKYDSEKGKFSSWVYKIARNSVIDHYRTKKFELDVDDAWDMESGEDMLSNASDKEKIEKIRKYLNKLDHNQRDIVLLRVWSGLSYAEISEIMGKSEANCKVIFSRVIAKLKKEEVLIILLCLLSIKLN